MMSWTLLVAIVLALGVVIGVLRTRRAEIARMSGVLAERDRAKETGSHRARLQYPHVDLSRCIGCGTCVKACPEDGVLELVHGQAVVVHGARCVGHGLCAQECPVGAIAVTLEDLAARRDIPALSASFESTRVRGVFLAGEVTGYALVRTAIAHGTAVADEVARRVASDVPLERRRSRERLQATLPAPIPAARRGHETAHDSVGRVATATLPPVAEQDELDLVIVGAGPAGLACALRAKERGLSFLVLEQDEIGGTVAKYPRRKLVMTQPVELPLVGKLDRTSYSKEELIEMWHTAAREQELPMKTGQEFVKVDALSDGRLVVITKTASFLTRHACLALGRRGTPRRLGVPGEDLPKVAYSLLDAQSYTHRKIVVVGGGDSAVEAALGLAEQPGNEVVLSYRQPAFSRLKSRNEARLLEAVQQKELRVITDSALVEITPDAVCMMIRNSEELRLANDEVFVFAGGTPPFQLLEASGVSFDPNERPSATPIAERGSGLFPALIAAFVLAACTLAWAFWFRDYYTLEQGARYSDERHRLLSPSGLVGLTAGVGSSALVLFNLAYLARRALWFRWLRGSLQAWMTSHIVTGIGALLLALVHAAMQPRHTVGGHAFVALSILVLTGAIGRYFYSFVPRAANGRELALDEVRSRLAAISGEWDRGPGGFGDTVRAEVQRLITVGHWKGSFFARLLALLRSQRDLRHTLEKLRRKGQAEGVARGHLIALIDVARRAQRAALMAAHYEDLRAILSSWRYFHRWVALGMVLLVVVHVSTALRYSGIFD